MFMDAAQFPIVRLHYDQKDSGSDDENLDAFEALLDRRTPFVIIGEGSPTAPDSQYDPSDRRRVALWSIANKSRLRAFAKVMIYIEPSAAKRTGMKAFMSAFERFWGYPMVVTASETGALDLARALLDVYAGAR